MEIHAVQHFTADGVWKTIYLTSFPQDAADTYMDIRELTPETLRAVRFTVDSYDFVATHARDFAVLALREAKQTA